MAVLQGRVERVARRKLRRTCAIEQCETACAIDYGTAVANSMKGSHRRRLRRRSRAGRRLNALAQRLPNRCGGDSAGAIVADRLRKFAAARVR
jgi:hypothetical protein